VEAPVWTDLLFRLFVGGDGLDPSPPFFSDSGTDFFAKAD